MRAAAGDGPTGPRHIPQTRRSRGPPTRSEEEHERESERVLIEVQDQPPRLTGQGVRRVGEVARIGIDEFVDTVVGIPATF